MQRSATNDAKTGSPAAQDVHFPLGAHLVTPRRGYTHHGIYVGGGQVVHYMGLSSGWHRGPVSQVTLAQFASGRAISIQPEPAAAHTPLDIAARARSRLGEDRYSLLRNNCEHFCAWCAHGVARSSQVDRFLGWPSRFAQAARSLLLAPLGWAATQGA